jgi:hypothetical protein
MRSAPISVNHSTVLPSPSSIAFIWSGWRVGGTPGSGGKGSSQRGPGSPSPRQSCSL